MKNNIRHLDEYFLIFERCSRDQFQVYKISIGLNRARKSRTTLQNKVRLKVLPEQLTLTTNNKN